jgi:hypothetical protein
MTNRKAYTRESDGKVFEYAARCHAGEIVQWSARVWCDGDYVSTLTGTIDRNKLVNIDNAVDDVVRANIRDRVGVR